MSIKKELQISEETQKFLESNHLLYINGEWKQSSSGEYIEVIDPATENNIAKVQSGNGEDIDCAVQAEFCNYQRYADFFYPYAH